MDPGANYPPGLAIVQLSGPLIVADLGDWGLTGAMIVQLYLYYVAFPNDTRFTKCLVYIVCCLQLVQVIMASLDAFSNFGYGFGDIVALTKIDLSWFSGPIISGIVSFIVQSFYAFRLYNFSKSRIIPVLIVVASLAFVVPAFMIGRICLEVGVFTELNTRRISIIGGVWLSGAALVDVIIAVSMTYYLIMSDTGFRQTHAMVTKLIRSTIQTGSLTASVAVVTVILFFAFPEKGYYLTPITFMPGLYANAMLALLNSRLKILGNGSTFSTADTMSFPAFMRSAGTTSSAGPQPAAIVSLQREAFSNEEIEPSMEMKSMQNPDIGARV
ncbi:hypothetical protein DFH07DRAFT_1056768 [Mycena maculata]|uniref:DUF6534 domain-containing protein n=1 Tax=Mycena maculata TaxID=230809 RepID=A0AAD7NV45_9AGAR|nr:hypothetical protein DFH07DRAFT_1056768 [Mycena maculata]